MATIHSTITSVGIGEHNMTRSHAIDFCREHLALLSVFNEKGDESSLEAIYYILKVLLLFHN